MEATVAGQLCLPYRMMHKRHQLWPHPHGDLTFGQIRHILILNRLTSIIRPDLLHSLTEVKCDSSEVAGHRELW